MQQQYLRTPQSLPNGTKVSWPTVPAKRGEFYGVTDPQFSTDKLVVMLEVTWTDVGTTLENQKRTLQRMNEAILHLKNAMEAQAAELRELRKKHKNLTKAYKEGRYARMKNIMKTPDDEPFNPLGM